MWGVLVMGRIVRPNRVQTYYISSNILSCQHSSRLRVLYKIICAINIPINIPTPVVSSNTINRHLCLYGSSASFCQWSHAIVCKVTNDVYNAT